MSQKIDVGIGLRRAHFGAFEASRRAIDFVEVQPETFIGSGGAAARALAVALERTRVVPHSVSLSLGGPDPLCGERLASLATFCERVRAPYLSDHLCISSIDGRQSFDLLPLPHTCEAAEHVASRLLAAKRALGVPVVLENITTYELAPVGEEPRLSEGAFVRHVLEAADAGLLLDINNVVVNAKNLRVDPVALLDALPLERTRQIHLAGHRFDRRWRLFIDDHASAVGDETLALYGHALRRIGGPVPTLLEWDQSLPSHEALLDEVDRIRQAAEAALASVRVRAGSAALRTLPHSGGAT